MPRFFYGRDSVDDQRGGYFVYLSTAYFGDDMSLKASFFIFV